MENTAFLELIQQSFVMLRAINFRSIPGVKGPERRPFR
jgi:hypothetical protein